MKKVIGLMIFITIVLVVFVRSRLEPVPEPDTATPSVAAISDTPDASGEPGMTTPAVPPGPASIDPLTPRSDPKNPVVETPNAVPPITAEEEPRLDNLYTRFEDEAVDPQWSEEHEILIENFLFSDPGYVDLDIESITCKSTLCELKVSEKENTVWAKVVHDLTREQGWELSSWKYADYYENGRRIIHTVVGKPVDQENDR